MYSATCFILDKLSPNSQEYICEGSNNGFNGDFQFIGKAKVTLIKGNFFVIKK